MAKGFVVSVTSLDDARFRLPRDLPVVVQPTDVGYVATFFDANASMAGDTQEEAVANLKAWLVDLLDDLESEAPERLGAGPARQLAALRSVIQRA